MSGHRYLCSCIDLFCNMCLGRNRTSTDQLIMMHEVLGTSFKELFGICTGEKKAHGPGAVTQDMNVNDKTGGGQLDGNTAKALVDGEGVPSILRAYVFKLIRVLYIDREPQACFAIG